MSDPRFEVQENDDGFDVVLIDGDEALSTGWWGKRDEAEALVKMLNEMLENWSDVRIALRKALSGGAHE